MADLDKKIQKAGPDLVQSVLEAHEKRNIERVDMLVTNAIKQLKMSRFKPDQTTCISLTYLARVSPKVFLQSTVIKDTLKSMLRRDNGPTNIKGKNDLVLPVLAANILLACCDCLEVRTIVLNKIDQWLSGSNGQKAGEMVQHLLATLCMKCQGDQQTINTLIEMRQHWIQYLEDNFDLYGSIPVDLCASIRKLLYSEMNCERLIGHLNFLVKHDNDIDGLGDEISRFIMDRPISLNSMLNEENNGAQLNKMMLKVFIKLFRHLNSKQTFKNEPPKSQEIPMDEDTEIDVIVPEQNQKQPELVVVKQESMTESAPADSKQATDMKPEIKSDVKTHPDVKTKHDLPANKGDTPSTSEMTKESTGEDSPDLPPITSYLYIRMLDRQQIIKLNQSTLEALLNLIASIDNSDEPEFDELMKSWLVADVSGRQQLVPIYEDFALTRPYNLPEKLRQKLIHSQNDILIELGLRDATTNQLMTLLQQFGSSLPTIEKINKRIESIKDTELLRSEIKDLSYFNHLMDFYHELGSTSSRELQKRLATTVG